MGFFQKVSIIRVLRQLKSLACCILPFQTGTLLDQTATANMQSLDQLYSQIVLVRQCHVKNL
jgi:hypothetical protein